MENIDLEFRNAVYSRADGSQIDVEINHPELGWVPFTASSNDTAGLSHILYAATVAAGNVAPYVPPPPLSDDERRAAMPPLTARRLRLGLIKAEYSLAQVQAALEAMPEGQARDEALVEWEYAGEFDRLHPLIIQIGNVLGLTEEKIDEMWMASASL